MTIRENEAIARRFEEAINTGNTADAAEFIAPDFIQEGSGIPPVPTGIEGFRELARAVRTAFPDFNLTIEDMVVAEDKVAIRYTISGTHQGEFLGIPPTGKEWETSGVDIIHIAGGKITRAWSLIDILAFYEQIGVVQPSPVAQAAG